MTHILRQDYRDITLTQIPHDHDICQLKYDGIWCAAHVQMRTVNYVSRNGLIKRTDHNVVIPDGVYIGELMFGSEWAQDPTRKDKFFLFDCLEFNKTNLKDQPYQLRYTMLQHALNMSLHPHWSLVANYSTSEADNIWTLVVDPGHYEGMVFRNSHHSWNTTILRAKKEITTDLVILGYVAGQGRLTGCLGALVCARPNNLYQEITVGGGMTDQLRKQIWTNQDQFLGRTIRVTAKKIFASGLLRHPNFHSFHDDK